MQRQVVEKNGYIYMRTICVVINRPMHSVFASSLISMPNLTQSIGNAISWGGNHILGRVGFKEMDTNIIKGIYNQSPKGSEELFNHTLINMSELRSF
jgi:hypothetical protein